MRTNPETRNFKFETLNSKQNYGLVKQNRITFR